MALQLTGLEGKVAVITGAGRMRSIGRGIALELARGGCDVVITGSGRSPEHYPQEEKDAGWNDIGSWSSLWDAGAKDASGSCASGDVELIDAKDSLVRSDSGLVSVIGLDEFVVVSTIDAMVVAYKSRVQDVKVIAADLQKNGRSECELHREVYRS